MKLKKVTENVIKPKKKLTKIIKPKVIPCSEFSPNYTGIYKGNFPFQPKLKKSEVIHNEWQLQKLSLKMSTIPAFAFDTETNTLRVLGPNKDFKCVGISISWGEDNNYYIPTGHIRDEDLDNQVTIDLVQKYLKPIFERQDVKIIGWNLKFDFHVLTRIGINVKTVYIFDGMLASWLCDENTPNGLKENSTTKMGISQSHFKDVTKTVPNEIRKKYGYKANSKIPFDLVLIKDGAPYAIDDAFYSWCHYLGFEKELQDEKMDKIYKKVSIPFLFALYEMEELGVSVDIDKLEQMGIDMQKDLDRLQYEIYETAGVEFNIGSSQQKAEILFGYRKPDKEIDYSEAPKSLDNVIKIIKQTTSDNKGLRRSEIAQAINDKIESKGVYVDDNLKLFKKANVNENILEYSFGFRVSSNTDSGAPSTDADSLWRISQMTFKMNKRKQQGVLMCKKMLEYSKIAKLKTAFVDGILEQLYDDGKVHPSFNQIGTDSGRLSCSSPNLQQLPKASDDDKYQIRSVFIGSEYAINNAGVIKDDPEDVEKYRNKSNWEIKRKKIVALDYKNLEMMCLTHFSKDQNLLDMFNNNEDAHGSTAVNMFNLDCTSDEVKKLYPHLRQAAKTINFMLMYGGGAGTLYDSLKSDHDNPIDLGDKEYLKLYGVKNGKQVAQIYIDKYFESYSGVAKFITGQKKFAHRNKFVLTILGRKRRLPDINSSDGYVSSYNERLSVNSAIQGTAGDITISAQNRIQADERLKDMHCRMIIQVHDEIVFECPEEYVESAITIIKHLMTHPFGDNVKLNLDLVAESDYGDSYQDAK